MKTNWNHTSHNRGWAVLIVTTLSIFSYSFGIAAAPETDSSIPWSGYKQITGTELERRVSRLEGDWQHLSVSGSVSFSLSAYEGRLPGESDNEEGTAPLQRFPVRTHIGARNRISLSLQAGICDTIEVDARLAGDGLWGVNYPGELALAPAASPSLMRLEEFAAVYHTDTVWVLAGRRTFAMGPIGLLVSNTSVPIDLVDAAIAKGDFVASAIAGRLSSEYYMGTDYVIDTDDYFAVRLEKRLTPEVLLGLNGLLSGIGDASGQSVDLQSSLFGRPLVIELARYNPGNTITEESRRDAYAWLTRIQVLDTDTTSASVSYGAAGKGFAPAFSSIASSSGATEDLIHNTQNLTVNISRSLGSGYSVTGEISASRFLDAEFAAETYMSEAYPLLRVGVTASKQIAPYSVISATISHTSNEEVSFRRFGVDLQLNF